MVLTKSATHECSIKERFCDVAQESVMRFAQILRCDEWD